MGWLNTRSDTETSLTKPIKHKMGWLKASAILTCLGVGAVAAFNYCPGPPQHSIEHYAAKKLYDTSFVRKIPNSPKPYGSSVKILDAHNNLIKSYGTKKEMKDIPKKVEEAVLACEDHYFRRHDNNPWYINSFMTHEGVSLYNICGAAIDTLKGNKRGASTIIMQNAKNIMGNTERNYSHKLEEIIQSYTMFKKFGRDWNLDFYINNIALGNRISGFPAAAEMYFGKKLDELNMQQLVALGSFIPNHNRQIAFYEIAKGKSMDQLSQNMQQHAKASFSKINSALRYLRGLDEITDKEYWQWKIKDETSIRRMGFIDFNPNHYGIEEWTARSISQEIGSRRYNIGEKTISGRDLLLKEHGDIVIETDLDIGLIDEMKKSISDFLGSKYYDSILRLRNAETWQEDILNYKKRGIKPPYDDFEGFMNYLHKNVNVGAIAVNQKGNIVGYVGGKEFIRGSGSQDYCPTGLDQGSNNIIIDLVNKNAAIPAGSTIKPLTAYYAMAYGGMDLDTKRADRAVQYKYNKKEEKKIWMPRNWYDYDKKNPYGARYDLCEAQVKSVNTIFARLYQNPFIRNPLLAGFDKVRFKYDKEDSRWWPYGIGSFDANIQKWLGIYSAFLDGYYKEPSFVTRISIDGNVIYNKDEDVTKRPIMLFDRAKARKDEMKALHAICDRGSGSAMKGIFKDYVGLVTGKTGTESEQKASLFVSHFNPYKNRESHDDQTLTMAVVAKTNTGGHKRIGYSTECPVKVAGKIYKSMYEKELDKRIQDTVSNAIDENPELRDNKRYLRNVDRYMKQMNKLKHRRGRNISEDIMGVDGQIAVLREILDPQNRIYAGKDTEFKRLFNFYCDKDKVVKLVE